jgi:protoheme IX farnesyltransferase
MVQAQAVAQLRTRTSVGAWVMLTKPGIIVLLLVTTLGGMLAAPGELSLSLVLWTMLGGALCSASATTLNSFIDLDIDAIMKRTSRRPLPTQQVSRTGALALGIGLGLASVVVFTSFVNWVSALLGIAALLYYVLFYSGYLKRSSVHNVVIGGVAGAFPPLIGWTAVTGAIDPGGLFLFLIVFFWTPPHAWALTLLMQDDYRAARVPMMPVAMGEQETHRQIYLYSISLLAVTIIPATLRLFGPIYFGFAVVLGGLLVAYSLMLYRQPSFQRQLRFYRFSTLYLALLFLGLVLDQAIVIA